MTEVINVPVEALHQQEFIKGRKISFGVFTKMLDALVTAHGRSIGVLFNNEKIMIDDIVVDGDHSTIEGYLYEQEIN